MQERKRLLRHVVFLALLTAAVSLPSTAQGPVQSVQPADDDDELSSPILSVNLQLSETGDAVVSGYSIDASGKSRDLKPAVEASLRCHLKDKFTQIPGSVFGSCLLAYVPAGLLHTYRFSTQPLVAYAHEHEIDLLNVTVSLPETEIRQTVPAVESVGPNPKISPAVARSLAALRSFSWKLNASIPESIEVRLGYDAAGVQRRSLLLLAALLFPILAALWLKRRALSAQAADKSAIWFSYLRCQQWLLNGALLAWWASEQTVRLQSLLSFLIPPVPAVPWLASAVSTMAIWLAPSVVWIVCVLISHPVQQQLRGLRWTRKELGLQAIYSMGSALFPLLLGIQGISALLRGNFRTAVLWILAALILKIFASTRLLKLLGMQPQALTTGELRDAAFNMAHRLGVKLQQIFVIPAGKSQMANAFARKGNTIAFTDYLLLRMTRREVNYVLAHELSHLRLKHPQKLSYALLGNLGLAFALTSGFRAQLPNSYFFRYALFFTVVTAGTYFWSRRFEFSADRGAVEATGDPHGAISALYKLASLNMHPLQWGRWSEKWLTHPSSLRRAQAIAKRAAIPLESLPQIAQSAMREDPHYEIPLTTLAGNKVLTTTKKMKSSVAVALAMLAAIILTPTAFALLVKYAGVAEPLSRILYIAGFLVSILAYLFVVNVAAGWRLRPLIPQLRAKAEQEGVQPAAWNAVPVGLAPGALPRTFEGHSHWDLGFLFLRADRICYWGEEARFALRCDQIAGIQLGPSTPNLLGSRRIYIAWRDSDQGVSADGISQRPGFGVLSFASAEPATLLDLRKRTDSLYRELVQWRIQSGLAKPVPAPLDSLGSPRFGQVTCASPLSNRKPKKILKELYLLGLLAAAIAVVAGLPFHLTQTIARVLGGRALPPSSPGSGWYVVGVTLAVLLLQYIPYFFYKDVPVLRADVSSPTKRTPESTPTEEELQPVGKV
jgi:heat shock protein HtpX